jgi:excisionase family DNA binding protein
MDQFLNIKEVAAKLKKGQSTIYRWIDENKIPFTKMPGGTIRFQTKVLEKWIQERTVEAKHIGQ